MRRSQFLRASVLALGILSTTSSLLAQELRIVLRKGLPILGANGDVKNFQRQSVIDSGLRYSIVRTTNPDQGADQVLLLNQFLSIPEGSFVAQPSGAMINGFPDLDVNSQGFVGWPLSLETGNDDDDSGIYWNTLLLLQEGSEVEAPGFDGDPIPAGTIYDTFNSARINDRNQILYTGRLLDADENKQFLLARLETNGAGVLVSEEILAWEDHPLPGKGEIVGALGTGQRQLALNNAGQYMGYVELGDGPPASRDSALLLDGDLLFREGEPSILDGRSYASQIGAKFDLNDFGDYVTTAFVDGDPESNALLIVNGELFAQKGEIYAPFAPDRVDQWGPAPHYVANSGDVFWHALTDGEESMDQAISRNMEAVIRKGVTVVDGEIVTSIERGERGYNVSDSGRFLLAEVETGGNNTVQVLADFGTHFPLPGCVGNAGTLRKVGGEARLGGTMELELDDAQGPGVLPIVYWSFHNAGDPIETAALQCGVSLPVGEVMIDLRPASRLGVMRLAPWTGAPAPIQIPVPNDPSLVNAKVFGQGVFWDAAQTTGGPTFQLTNGYYVEIGAP